MGVDTVDMQVGEIMEVYYTHTILDLFFSLLNLFGQLVINVSFVG